MDQTVAAIVLNWNNAKDTMSCIESVLALDYPHVVPIVVDNGSIDDSVCAISSAFPKINILQAGENLGYAGGNNMGIEYAIDQGYDYLWLLNDDVTVAVNSLTVLMSAARWEPDAGFLGPKIYIQEDPKRILSAGGIYEKGWRIKHRGLGEMDDGRFDSPVAVDYLSGCALLVKAAIIEKIGALDDDFFCYYEDVEWCYRAKQAGLIVQFVPQARVWHPDTRNRDANSSLVTYYMARNHLLFVAKHHLGIGVIFNTLIQYLVWVINWSLQPKWRHKRGQRDAILRAMSDLVRGRLGQSQWIE